MSAKTTSACLCLIPEEFDFLCSSAIINAFFKTFRLEAAPVWKKVLKSRVSCVRDGNPDGRRLVRGSVFAGNLLPQKSSPTRASRRGTPWEQSTDKVTEEFTGKELDDETGLNYFGARYLDAMLGMWVSVDPAREFANPYSYVGYSPLVFVDPDGKQSIADELAVQYVNSFGNALDGSLDMAFDVAQDALTIGLATGAAVLGTTGAIVGAPILVNAAIPIAGTMATGAVNIVGGHPTATIGFGEFVSGVITGLSPTQSIPEFIGQVINQIINSPSQKLE
jgi:RHS repeat-associated protein